MREADPHESMLALAKLGDKKAEKKVLEKYEDAHGPKKKAEAALDLGYVATDKTVMALARDIRTTEVYIWLAQSRRSMRVHIIMGLHRAFPTEPVFFPPIIKPKDDSYYEKVEQWLTNRLGVTWDRPRPPFLYEEEAPRLP